MRHRWEPGDPCAWNADKQADKWYDWAGWGEFLKNHPCHLAAYGQPNLHNVTFPNAKAWWGHGDPRDVMTMLLKENFPPAEALMQSYVHEAPGEQPITLSYVWRSVIRTVGNGVNGAYKHQHARIMERVRAKRLTPGPPRGAPDACSMVCKGGGARRPRAANRHRCGHVCLRRAVAGGGRGDAQRVASLRLVHAHTHHPLSGRWRSGCAACIRAFTSTLARRSS